MRHPPVTRAKFAELEKRVDKIQETQSEQGKTLTALATSDVARTAKEKTSLFFITRVIPGIGGAIAVGIGVVLWLIANAPGR